MERLPVTEQHLPTTPPWIGVGATSRIESAGWFTLTCGLPAPLTGRTASTPLAHHRTAHVCTGLVRADHVNANQH